MTSPVRSPVVERAIVNASPLILMARSGLFDLLRLPAPDMIVPSAVEGEILRRGPFDPTVIALGRADWLRRVDVRSIPRVITAWDLGAGESSVLAWAMSNPGTEAILD